MNPLDFDLVVVLGLERRPERLKRFWQTLPKAWPCRQVRHVAAVDGKRCKPPDWYRPTRPQDRNKLWRPRAKTAPDLSGAWGCLRSHHRIWETALNSGADSVLVFEDDAIFCPEFSDRLRAFLDAVPDDWDQLYLGGQHLGTQGQWPIAVNTQVIRGRCVNRTHAYAIRGPMLAEVYRRFAGTWASARSEMFHVDHQLCNVHRAYDAEAGRYARNIYCPRKWLVGQAEGISDVKHQKPEHEHWWNDYQLCDEASTPGRAVAVPV